ncbi:hypothetical protein GTO91_03380 [Heliobacterium undosum]|uniref:Uncharacterized protein n=1 Tax=Heliomicrobium undosum TaxID=121734 RepID=A0A845L2L2_9FIRM|nr:hypothetical protein [Heliomicrobium undosum]MZP28750.1 hypothetical protein [Heliomicrobium undosum]
MKKFFWLFIYGLVGFLSSLLALVQITKLTQSFSFHTLMGLIAMVTTAITSISYFILTWRKPRNEFSLNKDDKVEKAEVQKVETE